MLAHFREETLHEPCTIILAAGDIEVRVRRVRERETCTCTVRVRALDGGAVDVIYSEVLTNNDMGYTQVEVHIKR